MNTSTNWKLYNELTSKYAKNGYASVNLIADGTKDIEVSFIPGKDNEVAEEKLRLTALGYVVKVSGRKYKKIRISK